MGAFGTPYFENRNHSAEILEEARKNLGFCDLDELESLWSGVKKVNLAET